MDYEVITISNNTAAPLGACCSENKLMKKNNFCIRVHNQYQADEIRTALVDAGFEWAAITENDFHEYHYLKNRYCSFGAKSTKDLCIGFYYREVGHVVLEEYNLQHALCVALMNDGTEYQVGDTIVITDHNDGNSNKGDLLRITSIGLARNANKMEMRYNYINLTQNKSDYFFENCVIHLQKSVKASLEDINNFFNKTKTMSTAKFQISGSKSLKTAFIAELSAMGYHPTGRATRSSISESDTMCMLVTSDKTYTAIIHENDAIQYSLPLQWDEALKAAREIGVSKSKLKVGDFVTCVDVNTNFRDCGDTDCGDPKWRINNGFKQEQCVGAITEIASNGAIKIKPTQYWVSPSAFRLATQLEISAYDSTTIEIGSNIVPVLIKKGTFEIKGNKSNIEELRRVFNLFSRNLPILCDFSPKINLDVRFIRYGCEEENHMFSLNDILSVLTAHDKL